MAAAAFVSLALGACSPPAPITSPIPAPQTGAASNPSAYPVPSAVISASPTTGPTPTANAARGTAVGQLALRANNAEVPLKNTGVYLAELVKDAAGKEVGASFDRATSPRASTDDQGRFTIYNAPPGRYSLVIDTIRETYMLRQPSNGNDLIIVVTAGQRTDLGRLVYSDLPITPQP